MHSDATRSRRDTYLGIAAATTAVAMAVAALCVVIGFVVSRRSLLGRDSDSPSLSS